MDLITFMNDRKINYLIFVLKNPREKDEFSSMCRMEKTVMLHEFSLYREGKKIEDSM
jgi:hypothetical protein